MLDLWKDLNSIGFRFLLTNQLNQDCLQNLFSVLRRKGGFRDNPNPQQFQADFRQVIVDKLFVHSTSANCENDADKILLDISNVTIMQKKVKEPSESRCAIEPVIAAMPAASIKKQNIVTYMAGYLIKQYPVDNCASCKQYFKVQNLPQSSPTSQYKLVRFKRYWDRKCLTHPSVVFSSFVQNIETIFCTTFGGVMYQGEFTQDLVQNDAK